MNHKIRTLSRSTGIVLSSMLTAIACAYAQNAEIETAVKDYLTKNPQAVQQIVREYLTSNPEVLQDAITALIKKRQSADNPDKRAVVRTNAELLLRSPRQVTLGNPNGDVTVVEFFDYNCGYCRRAFADMMILLKEDQNLKFVLKEFPILGPASAEVARVAVAVHIQDRTGQRYLDFHRKLLNSRGQVDQASALSAADEAGLDMVRLKTDIAGQEVEATLAENQRLARTLGITATPSYVIGDKIVPGAIGIAELKENVGALRTRTD